MKLLPELFVYVLGRTFANCTHVVVSLLKPWNVTVVWDSVQRCLFLTPLQEVTHHKLLAQEKSKFCKQCGKLEYSRYSEVSLLTLYYHWQTHCY